MLSKEAQLIVRNPQAIWGHFPCSTLKTLFEADGYKYMGKGADRIVFELSERHVIKIPLHKVGVKANKTELRLSRGDRIKFPRCRMFGVSLVMIKVLPIRQEFYDRVDVNDSMGRIADESEYNFPDFIWDFDCAQAGYHPKDNRIVMYDFAHKS